MTGRCVGARSRYDVRIFFSSDRIFFSSVRIFVPSAGMHTSIPLALAKVRQRHDAVDGFEVNPKVWTVKQSKQ